MRVDNGPRATVAMQPQDAREALEVVVDERVVQLLRGLLARRRHDAVTREKRELGPCGRSQRRGMHAQPAEVAHDEAGWRQGGAGEAQERILWVGFEGHAIVEQGWDDGRHEEARVPFVVTGE